MVEVLMIPMVTMTWIGSILDHPTSLFLMTKKNTVVSFSPFANHNENEDNNCSLSLRVTININNQYVWALIFFVWWRKLLGVLDKRLDIESMTSNTQQSLCPQWQVRVVKKEKLICTWLLCQSHLFYHQHLTP